MIEIKPLQLNDLSTLFEWMKQEHLYPFYMRERPEQNSFNKKFTPRIGFGDKTKSYMVSLSGQQFGYIQWYLNRNHPDYGASLLGKETGVSFDYFIGDPNFLGKGLGVKMLEEMIFLIKKDLISEDRIFYVGHDKENISAIRCSEKAGFIFEKDFIEKEKPSTLYVRDER